MDNRGGHGPSYTCLQPDASHGNSGPSIVEAPSRHRTPSIMAQQTFGPTRVLPRTFRTDNSPMQSPEGRKSHELGAKKPNTGRITAEQLPPSLSPRSHVGKSVGGWINLAGSRDRETHNYNNQSVCWRQNRLNEQKAIVP